MNISDKKRRVIWIVIFAAFILYCFLLIYYLLFFRGRLVRPGREWGVFSYERFSVLCNIVPFRTIGNYFFRLADNNINTDIVIKNIIGNLAVFAPMGLFIPVLFGKHINKFWKFLILLMAIIICVEIVQYISAVGAADIDDLILNTAGGCFIYAFMKIPVLNKFANIINGKDT